MRLRKVCNILFRFAIMAASSLAFACFTAYSPNVCFDGMGGIIIVGYNLTRLDRRDSKSEYLCLASAFYLGEIQI